VSTPAQPTDGRHEFQPWPHAPGGSPGDTCSFYLYGIRQPPLGGHCLLPADDPIHVAARPAEVWTEDEIRAAFERFRNVNSEPMLSQGALIAALRQRRGGQ